MTLSELMFRVLTFFPTLSKILNQQITAKSTDVAFYTAGVSVRGFSLSKFK